MWDDIDTGAMLQHRTFVPGEVFILLFDQESWGTTGGGVTQTGAAPTPGKEMRTWSRAEKPKHSCSTAVKGQEAELRAAQQTAGTPRTRCFFLLWFWKLKSDEEEEGGRGGEEVEEGRERGGRRVGRRGGEKRGREGGGEGEEEEGRGEEEARGEEGEGGS